MSRPTVTIPDPFLAFLDRLFEREGYVSNNAPDKGGLTYWGITKVALTRWFDRPAVDADFKGFTKELASQIYYQLYFIEAGIAVIHTAGLTEFAEFFFDVNVNHGGGGVKALQKAIHATPDGIVGNDTLQALWDKIKRTNRKQALSDLVDVRLRYYLDICKNDPTQLAFIVGWFNRASKFRPSY